MSPIPFVLILLALIAGFVGKRKGRKAILWGIFSILSMLLLSILAFLLLESFYRCNSEECKPLEYGLIIGLAATLLWIVLIPSKKE